MRNDDHYDIIIIGTGAGGGTIAYSLAGSGKKILILERGGFVPREADNWSSKAAVLDEKYHAHEQWVDSDGKRFSPGTHYNVGGNTKFYGAALFRMREEDFGHIRHHGGISPEWPISYNDLEPYYAQAEWLYEVRGERGSDPTEPWASSPYAYPAVSHEPRMQQLHEHFASKGLSPFHVPLGIRLHEADRMKSLCVRCQTCDGYPCLVNAKSDAQTMCVQPALQEPNVTLLTDAKVIKLKTDARGGQVDAVVVERHGQLEEYRADIVIVSCGAVNSAALLLRSHSDVHPNGLANSSDCVGRHYMAHNNSVLFMFSRRRNPTVFQKTLAVNDFYRPSEGPYGWEFPMGHISMVGKFDGHMFKTGAPPMAPLWLLEQMGRRSLDFWITSEDLPLADNRVKLSADGSIQLNYTGSNLEAHDRLVKTLRQILKDFDGGWNFFKGGRVPLAGVGHQCGTLRFGTDPRTSVLDINCKAHDLDNLYVVDGSFFPSSSAVNPALTIMANALRVGEHIQKRLGIAASAARVSLPAARLPVIS